MREDDLTRLGINAGRIGLEATDSRNSPPDHHRQHSGDIPLAASDIALGIKAGKSQAACVMNSGQEVETPDSQAGKAVISDKGLQCLIEAVRSGDGLLDGGGEGPFGSAATNNLIPGLRDIILQ